MSKLTMIETRELAPGESTTLEECRLLDLRESYKFGVSISARSREGPEHPLRFALRLSKDGKTFDTEDHVQRFVVMRAKEGGKKKPAGYAGSLYEGGAVMFEYMKAIVTNPKGNPIITISVEGEKA